MGGCGHVGVGRRKIGLFKGSIHRCRIKILGMHFT